MIDLIGILYIYFEKPWALLLIIPIIILFLYLIRKDFIKLHLDESYIKKRNKLRIVILISRILIVLLLLIALASPYIETTKTVHGDPKIKILIDNSTSMDLFDISLVEDLRSQLEERIPVELYFIGSGEESRVGDGILSNVRKNDNLLLVSDGNNNAGIELGDAVIQANNLGATISALNLKSRNYDASVAVYGSEKTTSSVENTFTVVVKQTERRNVHLVVDVDGTKVIDKSTNEEQITFKRTFQNGYHRITARIVDSDYFNQNNIFYKTVKVVPRPKVALIGNNEEIVQLFNPLYDITRLDSLPLDYKPYTALIVDDVPIEKLNGSIDILSNFISEGNGLFVVGGRNSYDNGAYNDSRFEQLLPVFVARAGKQKGDVYIVLVVDVSGSTGASFGGYSKVDVEKALALGILSNVSLVNYVGVVAFNNVAYNIAQIKQLLEHSDLEDKILRLRFSSGTSIDVGVKAAVDMMQNYGGSKNIILLSDGRTQSKVAADNAVKYASSLGIRVYTVGVGYDTDKAFMKHLANLGQGVYFEPSTAQQIKILFGETEVPGDKRVFPLVIIDQDHFITQGLDINAKLYGFNQVVPKTSASMLVADDVGDPILSVWRFGLGRVASLATDYKVYGFELLNRDNSILLTRITNWAIGDPERKNAKFIDISDGRVGEPLDIVVKSDIQPSSDEVALYKFDENLYRGTIFVNDTGFNTIMNAVFAVNYKREYEDIGLNNDLISVVSSTGGRMFEPADVDGIVEFVKQKSRREILTKKSYSWIFLLIGLVLYLIEVCVRRLVRHNLIL